MQRKTSAVGGSNSYIGANEDMFLKAFDSTPKLQLVTQKKLENELSRVVATISNPNADWDARVQAMKHFRSLVNSGLADLNDFHSTTLKTLEIPFQNNICDLRSQVVRETCITIAFLSCRLQQKFSRMAEILLPSLIKLIPNSAKIISTSALVAVGFIIQSTHNSRFITVIKYQLSTSKSKDVHRALCEIVERIVNVWPPQVIERQLNDLVEVIRLGICNSDEAARQYARRTFNVFAEHFREPADRLFNSLDSQRQRMLNNLNHGGGSTLSMNNFAVQSNIPRAKSNLKSSYRERPGPSSISLISRLKSSLEPVRNGVSPLPSPAPTTPISQHQPPTTPQSIFATPTMTSMVSMNSSGGSSNNSNHTSSFIPSLPHPITPRPAQNFSSYMSPALGGLQHYHHFPTQIPSTPQSQLHSSYVHSHLHSQPQQIQPQSLPHSQPREQSQPQSLQYQHNLHHHQQQQQQPQQLAQTPTTHSTTPQPQQPAASLDGIALRKAASYLNSVIGNNSIEDTQIVTSIKYFNSLVDKHTTQIVNKHLPELMPPLLVGIDNAAISVRKASVFALVAIHAKVGLEPMESYLTGLTITQRKLLEVYIKKFNEENSVRAK